MSLGNVKGVAVYIYIDISNTILSMALLTSQFLENHLNTIVLKEEYSEKYKNAKQAMLRMMLWLHARLHF